jgi:hypothetical protein
MGKKIAGGCVEDRRIAMTSDFSFGRSTRPTSTAPVVAALLIAAALMVGVGHIKSASIERAYRNTQYATASVVSVGANGFAKVRYLWAGKPRTGELDVRYATGVDSGDRLGLRVSDGGRRLQLETPFYAAVYSWTAAALAVIALLIVMSSWRSTAWLHRERKKWLPAELRRSHR